MENVVLVAPSRKFVERLPLGKIPDRKDFTTFKGRDKERKAYWNTVLEENKKLGEEFFEAIQSKKIQQVIKPL